MNGQTLNEFSGDANVGQDKTVRLGGLKILTIPHCRSYIRIDLHSTLIMFFLLEVPMTLKIKKSGKIKPSCKLITIEHFHDGRIYYNYQNPLLFAF